MTMKIIMRSTGTDLLQLDEILDETFQCKIMKNKQKKHRANDSQCSNGLLNCMIYQDTKIKIYNIFPVTSL